MHMCQNVDVYTGTIASTCNSLLQYIMSYNFRRVSRISFRGVLITKVCSARNILSTPTFKWRTLVTRSIETSRRDIDMSGAGGVDIGSRRTP